MLKGFAPFLYKGAEKMAMTNETSWMGKYRDFVESIIFLCNRSATRFNKPQYYNTSFRLTAIQIQIIEYTLEDNGEKMSAIAERLGITRGAFSNNVTKLVEMGLLEKEHRGNNKKDLFITVTDRGREEYAHYAQFIYDKSLRHVFALADELPPESIESFRKILNTFTDTLV